MKNKPCTFARVIGRILALLGVTLAVALLTAVGCVTLLCKGPSVTAQTAFVTKMCEQKETAWIPSLFLSDEEVQAVLEKQNALPTTTLEEIFPFVAKGGR